MTDDEITAWVTSLIERKAPESGSLDYKAIISCEKEKDRVEIAKDITSFANYKGGVLLYGVPEDNSNSDSIPVPKEFDECGIDIPNGLPEQIENIIHDVVEPSLPELEIRVLNINSKSILFVYHPESWLKPHMIEGYKHRRYYKRGNFRATVMDEKDVEAAYQSRETIKVHANNFFISPGLGVIPENGFFIRITLCPYYPQFLKEKMYGNDFIKWIGYNRPGERAGKWQTFTEGWRFRSHPPGKVAGKQYELRLFFNGGISYTLDLEDYINHNDWILHIPSIGKIFRDTFLDFAINFFEHFSISGPVSMQTSIHNARGLTANKFEERDFENDEMIPIALDTNLIKFTEETSFENLLNKEATFRTFRFMLGSAFGLWLKN